MSTSSTIAAEALVTAGVDLGGTNTSVGIVDGRGRVVATSTIPTDARGGAESFVAMLAAKIQRLCKELPVPCMLAGIGIASPAANTKDGLIHSPANLPWGTVDIVAMTRKFFDLPVTLLNDGDAAALGEMKFGAARGMSNFIVITLGTGLGAGIVSRGSLVHGESGVAGELGHVILEPGGRECGCRRLGCAETYVSATGLRRTVFELLAQKTAASALRGISFNHLSAKSVFELAQAGDAIARESFELTGQYLGRLLTNAVAVFDPEAIVLAGGLAHAGDMLFEPTRRTFEELVLEQYRGKVRILASGLPDGQAAILGASQRALLMKRESLVV